MKYFLQVLILFLLLSCDSSRLYEKNISINNTVWEISNKPSFEYKNTHTDKKVNLKINVRHSSSYQYSNLWLFVNIIDPVGELKRDTMECILAQKNGKWLGHGLTDIRDVQCQFKNYTLSKRGTYTFVIEQAMRHGDLAKIEKLNGIMEIGLRIEKMNFNE
tara:strand:- start:724 stop:1206 length:483 start_codon:yes stop_codon:yes gene_type:complete